MTTPNQKIYRWWPARWLPTALLAVGQAMVSLALPPQDIRDSAGNQVSNLPFTTGETYDYAPNRPPTDIALSNGSVNQSAGQGAMVGKLSTTDEDTADTHTYTLVNGVGDEHNSLFNISGASLRVNDPAVMAAGAYTVRVKTDDGRDGTYEELLTISVQDDVSPGVVGIKRDKPVTALTTASKLTWLVTFNEEVTGVDADDFALAGAVTGNLSISAVDGKSYRVSAESLNGTGMLGLSISSTAAITDLSTNALEGSFSGGETFNYQKALELAGWGMNLSGGVGVNSPAFFIPLPTAVVTAGALTGETIIAASAGGYHTLAVSADGEVFAWGQGGSGQLGTEQGASSYVPLRVDHSGVLAEKRVVAVAAGQSHSLALTSDGEVVAWGYNGFGQLGDGTVEQRYVPVLVQMNGRKAVAIAAGNYHSMLMTDDGKVFTWGGNNSGQLGLPGIEETSTPQMVGAQSSLEGKRVVAIASGQEYSLAVTDSGEVFSWGYNNAGQLGDGTTQYRHTPVAVNLGNIKVTAVAAGYSHTMALASDGRVYTWGGNAQGQLGNNSFANATSPVEVYTAGLLAGKTVVSITAGSSHCLAVTSDGLAVGWGENSLGLIGYTGPNTSVPVFVDTNGVLKAKPVVAMFSGPSALHSMAIAGAQLNTSPTGLMLDSNSIVQSAGEGATVGTLSSADPDQGDTHSYMLAEGDGDTNNASFTINGNKLLAVDAKALLGGTYSVRVRTTDALGATFENIFSITVTDDIAPVAANDQFYGYEDGVLTVSAPGVLGNDSDAANTALTAEVVQQTTNGSVVLDLSGGFVYTPNTNFNGTDSFTYKAYDGVHDSSNVTVVINVSAMNDVPFAANDAYTIDEDTLLTVSGGGVLTNDFDVDGDVLSAVLVSEPANGQLTLNQDGSFTYLPAANFYGQDSFTYRAQDFGTSNQPGASTPKTAKTPRQTGSEPVTVTITVNPVNDAPIAVAHIYSTDEDTTLTLTAPGVLEGSSDVEENPLTVSVVSNPSHGVLTLNTDGSFTYLAETNYFGSDSFSYQANDGSSNSEPATISLTIKPVDDPVVLAVNAGLNILPASSRVITSAQLQATDVETGADGLTYTLTSAPGRGSLRVGDNVLSVDGTFTQADIDAGRVVYSHVGDAIPHDGFSFTVVATDGGSIQNTQFIINLNRIEREGEHVAGNFSVSANGRYVAFQSTADNLVTGDENGVADIFVLDRQTGETKLISRSSAGLSADGASDWPRISADGRFVTFQSSASNLVANDSNNKIDVFVHDRILGTTIRVSVSSTGAQANADALNPAISANGRYVAFHSFANALVTGDTVNQMDVFVHDLENHTTERVSLASDGAQGDNASTFASLSADGRYVAFQSNARNLVPGDSNNFTDVFVHDRATRVTTRVSLTADGGQGNNSSLFPSISEDGRFVAFQANASNLVPGDTNNTTDVFVHDRETAETRRVSVSSAGIAGNGASNDPKISDDGRYIVFSSLANNLVAGDANAASDIFVYDRLSSRTERVSLPYNGSEASGASTKPVITAAGRFVGFLSKATNLLAGAIGLDQIYLVAYNDQPTIQTLAQVTLDEDATTEPITVKVKDAKTDLSALTLMVTTTDDTLFPSNSIVISGTNGARTLVLTPAANAYGSATVTVTVFDGSLSSTSKFDVTVSPINDAPVALADSAETAEDTLLEVSAPGVLVNDTDVEDSALTAVLIDEPAHGALELNADGSFSYQPNTNWHGTDTFTYAVNDGSSNSQSVTVTLTVTPVNDMPVANADIVNVSEDIAQPFTLTAGDADGDNLQIRIVSEPQNGTLSGELPNVVYTPNTNFHGQDSFSFVVNDGQVDSEAAVVSLIVAAVNDLPVANEQGLTLNEDGTVSIVLTGADVDADLLTFSIVGEPAHGTLSGELPNLVYTPNTNYHGSDSFTFVARDAMGESEAVTVSLTVTAVNDIPVVDAQSIALSEDSTVNITLTAADVDGDELKFRIINEPAHGTLTGELPNLVYTPGTNYSGSDSFTFVVNDGTTDSAEVTVALTIEAVNDAPVAGNESYSTDEEQTLTVNAPGLLEKSSDVEGAALSAQLVSSVSHGSLSLNANGSFTYTPHLDFFGTDTFTYRVNDGSLNSDVATVTLTVNGMPDAPVATNDVYTLNEDTMLMVDTNGVLTNDFDADNDQLTAVLVVGPSHGTLELFENGSFIYTPDANWYGTDGFSYLANDGLTDSEPVDVLLTVNPVNDAPVAIARDFSVKEDHSLTVDGNEGLLQGATDIEESALTAILSTAPTNGVVTINVDGSFTYLPNTNYHGVDAFGYRVNDGTDSGAEVVVTILVTAVNDAPELANNIASQNGTYGTEFTFTLEGNTFADVDGDALTYSASGLPAGVTFDATNRAFLGTPTQAGKYTVHVEVTDGGEPALSASAEFTIDIAKAALTASADDKTRTYGAANPELTITYTGFVGTDGASLLDNAPVIATEATVTNHVGVYPITLSGGSDDNYEITLVNGALTVTKASLVATAKDQSRSYGASNPELTIAYTGFVNAEDTNVLDTLPSASTEANSTSPVGSYDITLTGGADDNYDITLVKGTLTIGKATIIATADDQSRSYGAVNPEFTITYTGLVNGEASAVIDTLPTATADVTATTSVGTYPITVTGGSDDNYEITLVTGTLTISQATLVVTADDKSRSYGEANPELTISYTGFVNDEDSTVLDEKPTVSTAAIAASNVGSYPIELAGGQDNNYALKLANGTLVIGKASLTITASDAQRSYGQTNPVFAGSIVGLKNDDDITATYDSVATPASPAGTYAIVPTVVDPNSRALNYEIALVNGTLTVTSDDPPVITLDQIPGYYVIGNEAIQIDTNAVVKDGGSLDLDGGLLTVTIVSNATDYELIGILTNEVVSVEDDKVSFNGTVFGTFDGGFGTNALVVSFNKEATPAIVEALVRQITFETFETNTASRVIEMTLADGDGGVSEPAYRVLELNRPPAAPTDHVLVTEGLSISIPFSLVLSNDFDVDNDTISVQGMSVVSAHGGRVTVNGSQFVYRPPTNFIGTDVFAYLVDDGRGGEGIGVVSVKVLGRKQLVVDTADLASEGTRVLLGGMPWQTYDIQVSDNLATWSLLKTVSSDTAGAIQVLDVEAKNNPMRFYRAVLR